MGGGVHRPSPGVFISGRKTSHNIWTGEWADKRGILREMTKENLNIANSNRTPAIQLEASHSTIRWNSILAYNIDLTICNRLQCRLARILTCWPSLHGISKNRCFKIGEAELKNTFKIWGSRSGGCEEFYLLGSNAVWSVESRAQLATCSMLISCLAYSSILKMAATCSSETSVDFQRTTVLYPKRYNSIKVRLSSRIYYTVRKMTSRKSFVCLF
jgi:hypothetical protein